MFAIGDRRGAGLGMPARNLSLRDYGFAQALFRFRLSSLDSRRTARTQSDRDQFRRGQYDRIRIAGQAGFFRCVLGEGVDRSLGLVIRAVQTNRKMADRKMADRKMADRKMADRKI